MGVFRERITISNLSEQRSLEIDAVVDTGAFYSMFPGYMLQQLEVEPLGTEDFELADGTQVQMQWGHAWMRVGGKRVITVVAFGSDLSKALLGAYTLEGLRLAVDPLGKRLVPVGALPI